MKIVALVQARMGSTRLPGKVLRSLAGRPLIACLLGRLAHAREIDAIAVACPDTPDNDVLAAQVERLGVRCHRGSEHDVLARFAQAARTEAADAVVRITGDCPLVDPALVDACVRHFKAGGFDYVSNIDPPSFPDGLDVEVFSRAALEQADREATRAFEREHVTPYLREGSLFRQGRLTHPEDLSAWRWTVDEAADLAVVEQVFAHFAPDLHFGWEAVRACALETPELFDGNRHLARNEGATLSSGQKLWRRARQLIPGGNMLLSKRPEMFLPERWPAYYSQAKGCQVWDLDGNLLIDMSIMSVGTNILGYGHPEVDAAVLAAVQAGNLSTLNCPEEVWLAEKLIERHPWADMVRLARTGGEANAIAIRIARAASGRDKVAICGYHGWHDWYLSANLADDHNLDGHLLPGLAPKGVPRALQGTVFPFGYNDFEALQTLVDTHDIGVIKMEVMRHQGPQDGFLHKVRALASARGIVLIFDECTSGFRETPGGLHLRYGVEPDMAMFGKALGNGYAITALLGRREIMEAAQSTFISSTFWTERIGPSAALKTLEVMTRLRAWETITAAGLRLRAGWQQLAQAHGLQIETWGLPALGGYTFRSANALAYKTLVTQEMLKRGYLAGNSVYASIAHTDPLIDAYLAALDPVFALIAQCEAGRDVGSLLEGPVCHAGFKRLN